MRERGKQGNERIDESMGDEMIGIWGMRRFELSQWFAILGVCQFALKIC